MIDMQAQKLQAAMSHKLQQQCETCKDTNIASSIEESIKNLLAYVELSWRVQLKEMHSLE